MNNGTPNILDISGYRLMWMVVMFDLPVGTRQERKAATKFRQALLDMGFEMSQFSVYFRFCGTKEKTEKFVRKVREKAPPMGSISILFFTDRQFSNIITIYNRKPINNPEKPQQYLLF